jgi:hypothetical protein
MNMRSGQMTLATILGVILLLVVGGAAYYFGASRAQNAIPAPQGAAPSGYSGGAVPVNTNGNSTPPPVSDVRTYTNSSWGIALDYPSSLLRLTTGQAVSNESYIPPCTNDSSPCFFYIGKTYAGTNFGSAGMAVSAVASSAAACSVPQTGESGAQNVILGNNTFFATVTGGAALSHSGTSHLYRVYHNGKCYTFSQNISESSYDAPDNPQASYPRGKFSGYNDIFSIMTSALKTLRFAN